MLRIVQQNTISCLAWEIGNSDHPSTRKLTNRYVSSKEQGVMPSMARALNSADDCRSELLGRDSQLTWSSRQVFSNR